MTTEIVLMNPGAAVLAADSTVTIRVNGGKVHYHDVEKIFGLSRYHSVGVMVNGSSYFFGVPWEVVIKIYRTECLSVDAPLPTLEDYVSRFSKFLKNFHEEKVDQEHLQRMAFDSLSAQLSAILKDFKDRCGASLNSQFEALGNGPEAVEKKIDLYVRHLGAEVESHLRMYEKGGDDIGAFRQNAKEMASSPKMQELIKDIFSKAPLPQKVIANLIALAGIRSKLLPDESDLTTLVVCGYGADDYMPKMCQIDVQCILGARYEERQEPLLTIGPRFPAEFRVFGESEIAEMFLTGVSKQFIVDFREQFQKKISEKSKLARQVSFKVIHDVAEDVQDSVKKQILESVAHLPKHFLGNMAEKLITLSSIKSHVKDVDGSVGGAVSVAIISKGDGLVWISRPHYFDLERNPHFLARYQIPPKIGGTGKKPVP